MDFFLRLRKGSDLYGFSGEAAHVANGINYFQDQIEYFVEHTVIPVLYDCVPLGSECLDEDPVPDDCNLCPIVYLKAVDQIVEDND